MVVAAIALGKLGNVQATEPLIGAIQNNMIDSNESLGVVRAAAQSLESIGNAKAIEPLEALLNKGRGAPWSHYILDVVNNLKAQASKDFKRR